MYKVSVIIPIYNAEKYLRACLDSAVNQTLKEIEIICVDDGSTDSSVRIVEEYAEKFSSIRLIQRENGGTSAARNTGLDIAAGEYVCFLDNDDALDPQALEKLYSVATQEDLDVLYFNGRTLFENDRMRENFVNEGTYLTRPGDYSGICTGQTMFTRMNRDSKFFPSACLQLFRRAFLEEHKIRFYPGIYHENNLFSFQCAMLARRTDYVPDAFYFCRMRPDSIMTSSKALRHVEGYAVTYDEILKLLRRLPLQEDAAEQINSYLEHSVFWNAVPEWNALPEEEKRGAFAHSDAGVARILSAIGAAARLRQQSDSLAEQNRQLTGQLRDAKAELKTITDRQSRRRARSLWGFVSGVRRNGVIRALKQAAGGIRLDFRNYMIAHSRGVVKGYFILLKDKDRRTAVREVWGQLREAQQRRKRVAGVKRLMKTGAAEPLISFVLPVYNVEKYLEQALDSLLCQSMPHIEIICVDDGSTDRSLEILRDYEKKDPRVTVLTQENLHCGVARNHGMQYARGEYICFLDSDDFFAETMAQELYFAAKTDNADTVLFNALFYHNPTGEYREAPWMLNEQYLPWKRLFHCSDCPDTLYQAITPHVWTKLYRRAFLQEKGLQFLTLHNTEDVAFTYHALALAERIVAVKKPLVFYRVGLSGSLDSSKHKDPLCFYEALMDVRRNLEAAGLQQLLQKSYVNAALAVSLYNWRTCADPAARLVVEEALRNYVFRDLGILGHSKEYFYYSAQDYKDMQAFVGSSDMRLPEQDAWNGQENAFSGSVSNVWQALQEEEQNPSDSQNAAADHILYMHKQTEALQDQLQARLEKRRQLREQLTETEKKLKAAVQAEKKRKAGGLKGFVRAVRTHGVRHTVMQTVWNARKNYQSFMIAHSKGLAKQYFTLSKEKGRRFALRRLRARREDDRLRKQGAAAAERLMKTGAEAPLVSFVLPVYNVEPYLRQAMDCLIGQTMQHIEIICVDDGSTDRSLEILRDYEKKDSRVKVFTQKNQFAGAARNYGLKEAKGEYICFLDPDDFYEKELAEQAYLAAKADRVDVLLFNATIYDCDTGAYDPVNWLLRTDILPPDRVFNRNDCPDTLYQIMTPHTWTKLFRRQFLLDNGLQFQPLRNANDVYFCYCAVAMAERITALDKVLTCYRRGVPTSLQSTKAKDPMCFCEALKAIRGKLEELGLLEQLRRTYVNLALDDCHNNLHSQKDPAVAGEIKTALRTFVYRQLEIPGHEKAYYYRKDCYYEMLAILDAEKEKEESM